MTDHIIFAAVIFAALAAMFVLTRKEPPSLEKQQDALPPGDLMRADSWQIGPVIGDKSRSVGMPLHPTQDGASWYFDMGEGQDVHYVTARCAPLAGKSRIIMRYRVEPLDEGAFLCGSNLKGECPGNGPTAVTLYFAHRLNNWMGDGLRWWATFATRWLPKGADQAEIIAPLDARWTSVDDFDSESAPGAFADSKEETERVGFTFTNCTGFGHGAQSVDGRVRFRVLAFSIE